jgi:hypothetical protein
VVAANRYNTTLKRALMAACCLAAPTSAQAQVTPAREFDAIQIPSGGRPLVIERTSEIPRQLNAAIGRTPCSVAEDALKDTPVLIFRPADGLRVMALVPCRAIVFYSRAFMFDRSIEGEPALMSFPVFAASGGFSASDSPGLMSWDADSKTLTAWRGTDYCPAREMRHTYRQGLGELNGFALVKVESREARCGLPEAEWKVVWQAPPWNLPQ